METHSNQLLLFGDKNDEKNPQPIESFRVISIHKNSNEDQMKKRELYFKFLSLSDHLDKKGFK